MDGEVFLIVGILAERIIAQEAERHAAGDTAWLGARGVIVGADPELTAEAFAVCAPTAPVKPGVRKVGGERPEGGNVIIPHPEEIPLAVGALAVASEGDPNRADDIVCS